MKIESACLFVAAAALTITTGAVQAQNIDFYTGGSRIDKPTGCAVFCCLETFDPLDAYQEDGLNVFANDFAFKFNPCGFDGNYYPNGGMEERVRISRTDGGDFGHLEFEVAHGYGGCNIFIWATAYLDGNPLGDFAADVSGGTLIGFEGTFDEIIVGAYADAAMRDEMNESNLNAIAIDNACFDGASADCLTLAVDPLVAGSSASWNVSGATAGEQVAIVYGFSPGSTVVNGFAGYCASFGIQGVNQNKVICTKAADGAGNASCTKKVPAGVKGRRILSQAAERNTCPDECVSNLDDQTVG